MKIIIAHECDEVRKYLGIMLKYLHYASAEEIVQAESFSGAGKMIREGSFEIILISASLGTAQENEDGLLLVAYSRKQSPSARIVIMCDQPDQHLGERAKVRGANASLPIPATLEELKAVLDK